MSAPPEPELMPGTLLGYRFWSLGNHGMLCSMSGRIWQPRAWNRALCDRCEPAGRPVPSWEPCRGHGEGCGLHGAALPDLVRGYPWGVIEAKGRIIAHDGGFRAQYARVIALAEDAAPDVREFTGRHREEALALAGRYGVPLLRYDALMAEYPPPEM